MRQFILLPLSSFSLPIYLSLSSCYIPVPSSSSPLQLSLSLSSENTRSPYLASLSHRDVPLALSSSSSSVDSLSLARSSSPVSLHLPTGLFSSPSCCACTLPSPHSFYTHSCCSSLYVGLSLLCRIYIPALYLPGIHSNLLLS